MERCSNVERHRRTTVVTEMLALGTLESLTLECTSVTRLALSNDQQATIA